MVTKIKEINKYIDQAILIIKKYVKIVAIYFSSLYKMFLFLKLTQNANIF